VDLVRLGLDGARWGIPLPGRTDRRIGETIRLVGAEAFAERPIGELSGGEQQRLLIAQALVAGPDLLFLDEPLDSLDLPNQVAVAALLDRIGREQGMTILLVAHDVNPLLPYLDRLVYVAGGRVLSGRPSEVITTETLTELYQAPVEVLHTSDGRLVVVGQPDLHTHHHHD
jgi:zinc/manganese transport system ATP-binding protein